MQDDFKNIGQQGLDDAKADIQGWHWGVKLAVAVGSVTILGAVLWTGFQGMYRSATTTTTLNTSQMEIVKKEAASVASAFTEIVDGRTVSGNLMTCSNTDSDRPGTPGYGKVTCTARVPVVRLATVEGKQTSTVLFQERLMECGIPYQGTSGCKLGPSK